MQSPPLVGMNGDVQYYLATLAFNNGEQLEYFIVESSDFNSKLYSLEKLYLLLDFSYSTLIHYKIVTNLKHSL